MRWSAESRCSKASSIPPGRRRKALGDNDRAPRSSDYGAGDTAAEPTPSAAEDHHARAAIPGKLDNSARRGALETHPVGFDIRDLRDV
jgi:hypothetical protein